MVIGDFINNVYFDITENEKASFITTAIQKIVLDNPGVPDFSSTILKREHDRSTELINDIAIPRSFNTDVPFIVGAVCLSKYGVVWNDKLVYTVIILASNKTLVKTYFKIAIKIGEILQSDEKRTILINAKTKNEVMSLLSTTLI